MMRSLKSRLLAGIVIGMSLLLVLFCLTIYTVIRRALVNQFDTSLESMARMLSASVELDENEVELELEVQQMPGFQTAGSPTYYQLWRHDGSVAARSASLGSDDLLRFDGPVSVPVFQKSKIKNNLPIRTVSFKFLPRIADNENEKYPQPTEENTLTLVVARNAEVLQFQLRFLRWLLITASIVTIALSLFAAGLIARKGLRPLNSIAADIAAVSVDNLSARIGNEQVPLEVIPIKNRLNELLSRLEESFKRERQFTADVAHELRTPLAGVRSTIEVTLTRTRGIIEYQTALSECLEITEKMQTMVNNLLLISRLDACQVKFHYEQVHLAELINICWQSFAQKAIKRLPVRPCTQTGRIRFINPISNDLTIYSDSDNLSMVFSNLLNNAMEYTNEAGQIRITEKHTDDLVEISISNTGCQLTEEQVRHVFDRFWRSDASRSATGAHCGLGLALVKRIVTALSGSVTAELQKGGIFTIRLTLPVKKPLS